jgi:hypothetical protein
MRSPAIATGIHEGVAIKITRSYLKNGKLWLKSKTEASQWISPRNNGTSSNR